MSVQTAFQGEVQFRRYSDTSTQGQQVVFAVADREALESFIGKEGKRFMAVLVEIGDDEQPVAGNPVTADIGKTISKPNQRLGDLAWRAVHRRKDTGKFAAQIKLNGKRKSLGCFTTAEMAFDAYLAAKRKFHAGSLL